MMASNQEKVDFLCMERNCFRCLLMSMISMDLCSTTGCMHFSPSARWTWMWLNILWIVTMDWYVQCISRAHKLPTLTFALEKNWFLTSSKDSSLLEFIELTFLIYWFMTVMLSSIHWPRKFNQINSTHLPWLLQKISNYQAWISTIFTGILPGIPPWDPRFFLCLIVTLMIWVYR